MPAPSPRRFPFPVGPTLKDIRCEKVTTFTLEDPVYESTSEKWMQGYMKCMDDCGKITNHGGAADRRVSDWPNL